MNIKITIKGEAIVSHKRLNTDEYVDGYPDLQKLHGIDCQDNFVEYMDKCSARDKLSNGYTRFVYEDNKLYAVCEYEAKEMLTEEELEDVERYTSRQWSDGIGEGFEQFPCIELDDHEIFISMWHHNQERSVSQTFDGKNLYIIMYGMTGSFNSEEYVLELCYTLDIASKISYENAVEEYQNYEGLYGLRTLEEIAEEEGEEHADIIYLEEVESWIQYNAELYTEKKYNDIKDSYHVDDSILKTLKLNKDEK